MKPDSQGWTEQSREPFEVFIVRYAGLGGGRKLAVPMSNVPVATLNDWMSYVHSIYPDVEMILWNDRVVHFHVVIEKTFVIKKGL